MNTMTPAQAFANRTARLVSEATTPVYTTTTPEREHIMAVEIENDLGGRTWSHMRASDVDKFIAEMTALSGYSLSDVDDSTRCWCQA